tara:strand:- start:699 stop:1223 length:525 start_codon:yes stop_codon:yes gene_type:complete
MRKTEIIIAGAMVVLGMTQCSKKDIARTSSGHPIVLSDTTSYPIGYDTVSSKTPTWNDFVNAVIFVESSGRDSVVGDNGKAVGCLQIHPIMVREVNRKLKKWNAPYTYSLEDRYDREKSIEMFEIIAEQYDCCEDKMQMKFFEEVARRWNGGPKGMNKKSTIPYWERVKLHLAV